MYWHQHLKIPKKLKQVTLWIHPEGRVIGSLFLSLQSPYSSGEEAPLDALNQTDPFLVFNREELLKGYGQLKEDTLETCADLIDDGYCGKLVLVP